jgi:hypothetical protein
MQAAQAVSEALKRRDAEGYKFRLEPLDDATVQRLSGGAGVGGNVTTICHLQSVSLSLLYSSEFNGFLLRYSEKI